MLLSIEEESSYPRGRFLTSTIGAKNVDDRDGIAHRDARIGESRGAIALLPIPSTSTEQHREPSVLLPESTRHLSRTLADSYKSFPEMPYNAMPNVNGLKRETALQCDLFCLISLF